MSKTGIKKVYYGTWTADGEYTGGKRLSTVTAFNGNPNSNDASDYGDNRLVETDKSVTGGTISLEVNELTLEEKSFFLGHKLDASSKELVYNADDVAPYVGIGAIGTSKRYGKAFYVGKFYAKCQFGEPNDENATKQESTSFAHDSIEGSILMPESGNWKYEQAFATETEAETWLRKKVGIATDEPPLPV